MKNTSKTMEIGEKAAERKKRIKSLWGKAHERIIDIYGDMPDVRILNRFYSEKMIYGNNDSVILWDLVAEMRRRAKEKGYTTTLGGTDASCFTAYLLGMCENPLPLHYLCPVCKKIEFINAPALPWDMQDKPCECGGVMHAEGFDVPFETHIRMAHSPWPILWVSPASLEEAKKIVVEQTSEIFWLHELPKPDFASVKFAFLPFDEEINCEEDPDTAENKYDNFPHITIIPHDTYKCIDRLYEETGENLFESNLSKKLLANPRIIVSFANGDTDNIPNFRSKFLDMKEELRLASPKNYYDLLQFMGAMHGTNTWCDNAECLIRDGICSIRDIPTHRDDVFMLLRSKLREAGHGDVGIAYNIATKIRLGVYARVGISAEDRTLLEYLDLTEWFIPYAEKIQYMFPKAHNIESLRIALTLMWYKINYPEAFKEIMKKEGAQLG